MADLHWTPTITSKVVLTTPMTLEEATKFMGKPWAGDRTDGDKAGYCIRYPDGYVSWCPKAEHERVSREVSALETSLLIP